AAWILLAGLAPDIAVAQDGTVATGATDVPATAGDEAAADEHAGEHHFDGAQLGLVWIVPFVGILLSIALMPLAVPNFWHHNFGRVSFFWAAAFLVPFAILYGFGQAVEQLVHAALLEYIPFIILLGALF